MLSLILLSVITQKKALQREQEYTADKGHCHLSVISSSLQSISCLILISFNNPFTKKKSKWMPISPILEDICKDPKVFNGVEEQITNHA